MVSSAPLQATPGHPTRDATPCKNNSHREIANSPSNMPPHGVTFKGEDVFADFSPTPYVPPESHSSGSSAMSSQNTLASILSEPTASSRAWNQRPTCSNSTWSASRPDLRPSNLFDHDADFVPLRSPVADISLAASKLHCDPKTKTTPCPSSQTTTSAMCDTLTAMSSAASTIQANLISLEQRMDTKITTLHLKHRKELRTQFLYIKQASLSLQNPILKMRTSTLQDQRDKDKKKVAVETEMHKKKQQLLFNKATGKQPAADNARRIEEMNMDSIRHQMDAFTEASKKMQDPPESLHDVWRQDGHGGPGTLSWLSHVFKQHGTPVSAGVILQASRDRDC